MNNSKESEGSSYIKKISIALNEESNPSKIAEKLIIFIDNIFAHFEEKILKEKDKLEKKFNEKIEEKKIELGYHKTTIEKCNHYIKNFPDQFNLKSLANEIIELDVKFNESDKKSKDPFLDKRDKNSFLEKWNYQSFWSEIVIQTKGSLRKKLSGLHEIKNYDKDVLDAFIIAKGDSSKYIEKYLYVKKGEPSFEGTEKEIQRQIDNDTKIITDNINVDANNSIINTDASTIMAKNLHLDASNQTLNVESTTLNTENISLDGSIINTNTSNITAENLNVDVNNQTVNAESTTLNTKNISLDGTNIKTDSIIIDADKIEVELSEPSYSKKIEKTIRNVIDINRIAYKINCENKKDTLAINQDQIEFRCNGGQELAENTLVDFVCNKSNEKFILIHGASGTGKTIAMKQIADCYSSKEKIVFFVSLAKWRGGEFKEFLEAQICTDYELNSIEYEKMLKHRQKLVFMLDGYDEILYDFKGNKFEEIYDLSIKYSIVLSSVSSNIEKHIEANKLISIEVLGFSNEFVKKQLQNYKLKGEIKMLKLPINLYLLLSIKDSQIIEELLSKNEAQLSKSLGEYFFNQKISEANGIVNKHRLIKFHSWLAHSFVRNSVFNTIDLQPDSLPTPLLQKVYIFSSRIIISIILCSAIGLLLSGIKDYIPVGIISGLILGLFFLIKQKIKPTSNIGNQKEDSCDVRIKWRSYLSLLVPLYIALVIGIGLYTSLMTSRKPSDLVGIFSKTNFFLAFLFSTYITIVFGVRQYWQSYQNDIKLRVKEENFDWWGFWKWGIIGGVTVGIIGIIVTYIYLSPDGGGASYDWLKKSTSSRINGAFVGMALTGIPTFIGCALLGSSLFVSTTKTKISTSIIDTLYKSLYISIISFLITVSISLAIMSLIVFEYISYEIIYESIRIGTSFFITVFLWFGGADVLQHIVLRIILYISGKPLFFKRNLLEAIELDLVKPNSFDYEYDHSVIAKYLCNIYDKVPKVEYAFLKKYGMILLVLIILFPLFNLFRLRLLDNPFWQSTTPKEHVTVIATDFQKEHIIKDTIIGNENVNLSYYKLICNKKGTYKFKTNGTYNVGTYNTPVFPWGIRIGFFGTDMGSAWNIFHEFQHGSMLIKINNDWSQLYQFEKDKKLKKFTTEINLKEGDIVMLLINDVEYQNNKGNLEVYIN